MCKPNPHGLTNIVYLLVYEVILHRSNNLINPMHIILYKKAEGKSFINGTKALLSVNCTSKKVHFN